MKLLVTFFIVPAGIQPMVITWVQMTEKKYSLNPKGILLIINIGAFYVHELFWKLQCNSIGNNPRLRLYVFCEIGSEAGSVWFSSIWFSFNIKNWKSKLRNRDFQCLILKKWKSKIYNLNFQCLLLRKVKLNIILQYFENQKLKIENGQLVVLTFCFQFPPPKIQAIKNSNLTKQFMCSKFCKKRCYCWWNPK